MATLAECVRVDSITLTGIPMPFTLRLPVRMSDEELIAFSRSIRPHRVESNELGELEIMSPLGFEGGQREVLAMSMLFVWAQEHGGACASCDTGSKLLNEAIKSPDASWTEQTRIDALTAEQRRRYPPLCPDFLIEILSESDSRKDA